MKKIILTTIIVFSVAILFAQYRYNFDDDYIRPVNNFNLSILGEASLYSVNYERLLLNTSNFFLAAGLGLGCYNDIENVFLGGGDAYITIPHHITANIGNNQHFFELGVGGTFINENSKRNYINYLIFGYRIQPWNSDKVHFRIYGNIPFNDIKKSVIFTNIRTTGIMFLPFGISIGISF